MQDFKEECNLRYGVPQEGLLEIKFNNPRRKNAFGMETQVKLQSLFIQANEDPTIKCILLHGGDFFSSGNDLSIFMNDFSPDNIRKLAEEWVLGAMVGMLMAMFDSSKPLVVVVRGAAYGIACTMTGLADFIYCSPDATFCTPFMESS